MKTKQIILLILSFLSLEAAFSKSIPPRKILKMLKSSAILNDHFTGFALYDLTKRKMITGYQDDKYFTPASNTKLFTFYAGLKLLKDSIAGLQYIERGDSLIFWGTADPSFLDSQFKEQGVLQKLNTAGKKIYWANGVFTGDFYGVGWTYDDYNEYYQPEMSDLPMYGNVVRFSKNSWGFQTDPVFDGGGQLILQTDQSGSEGKFRIKREIFSNVFHQPNSSAPAGFNQVVPFKVSDVLLGDLLKQSIPTFSGNINYAKPAQIKVWNSISTDTLYKRMLLPSDNFIAEQVLLNIAASRGMEMNTAVVIDYVKKNFLADLPDKPVWVDGSGLSRQNLFTPRSMVRLCEKIYDELIFSFMNNNFIRPTSEIRSEMEKLINHIYKNY